MSTRSARVTQALWLAVAVAGTIFWAAGPVSQWTALQTICHPDSACRSFQFDRSSALILREHGISLGAYAAYTAVVLAAVWIFWYGLAALIVWRKPEDRVAILAAFFLTLFPLLEPTQWIGSADYVGAVSLMALILFGLLFPDGRFRPRWTRWLALIAFLSLPAVFPSDIRILAEIPAVAGLGWLIPIILIPMAAIGVQIYRFRRISTWTQRQQTKWAFLGLVVGILGFVSLILSGLFVQSRNGSLYEGFFASGFVIVTLPIPVFIGIAVLRSRLWDIDRVINRALVYVSLTGALAGIYIGGVLALEALLRLAVGGNSTLAIALSTLAIAALFGPLRSRIQIGIDRRFFRSKYDAEKIVGSLGERLRDEVDLAQLSHELTSVVGETLHPEHVSLWLAGSAREGRT